MIPSAARIISSILAIASGFSILAIIGILSLELLSINFCKRKTSFFDLTKDRATQSNSFLTANKASSLSFSVNAGREILVLGKLTPFRDSRAPPCKTLA